MVKKQQGYEITEEDIQTTITYLKHNDPEKATREGAIEFLQGMQFTSHLAAHRIVSDMMSGKFKKNKPIKNPSAN